MHNIAFVCTWGSFHILSVLLLCILTQNSCKYQVSSEEFWLLAHPIHPGVLSSITKCVVLLNEELHDLADFLSFLLGAFCRAVQCSIIREGLLHLPQVCLPETPELTELDFRFLLLLSEHSTIC